MSACLAVCFDQPIPTDWLQALNCTDAVQIVSVAPQLLVADDVEDRIIVTLAKLQTLLPGKDLAVIQRAIVQAPTVIFRFDLSDACEEGLPDDILELVGCC
jgi:hypothetical protein